MPPPPPHHGPVPGPGAFAAMHQQFGQMNVNGATASRPAGIQQAQGQTHLRAFKLSPTPASRSKPQSWADGENGPWSIDDRLLIGKIRDQEKDGKVHEKYMALSPSQQSRIDRLIKMEMQAERHPNAKWLVGYVSAKKSQPRGFWSTGSVTTLIFVVLKRQQGNHGAPPAPRNFGPELFDQRPGHGGAMPPNMPIRMPQGMPPNLHQAMPPNTAGPPPGMRMNGALPSGPPGINLNMALPHMRQGPPPGYPPNDPIITILPNSPQRSGPPPGSMGMPPPFSPAGHRQRNQSQDPPHLRFDVGKSPGRKPSQSHHRPKLHQRPTQQWVDDLSSSDDSYDMVDEDSASNRTDASSFTSGPPSPAYHSPSHHRKSSFTHIEPSSSRRRAHAHGPSYPHSQRSSRHRSRDDGRGSSHPRSHNSTGHHRFYSDYDTHRDREYDESPPRRKITDGFSDSLNDQIEQIAELKAERKTAERILAHKKAQEQIERERAYQFQHQRAAHMAAATAAAYGPPLHPAFVRPQGPPVMAHPAFGPQMDYLGRY